MAKAAPKRSDYPKGLIGQAKYDAALKRYKESYGPPSPKPTKPAKPAKPEGSVNRRGRSVPAKPKPAAKPTVADYKDGPGNVYDGNSGRLKTAAPRSPAIGAPIHARPQAFGSNTKISDGTLSAAPANGSVYAPQAGQAPRPNAPVASSYRDGGKGLYKGSEEYVKATGGNYNPLMQRTFGYQTGGQPGAAQAPGTPPQSNDKVNTPDQRDQFVSPEMSPQYNGNDEPGALGQAENPLAALGQMLLQRKKLSISMSN